MRPGTSRTPERRVWVGRSCPKRGSGNPSAEPPVSLRPLARVARPGTDGRDAGGRHLTGVPTGSAFARGQPVTCGRRYSGRGVRTRISQRREDPLEAVAAARFRAAAFADFSGARDIVAERPASADAESRMLGSTPGWPGRLRDDRAQSSSSAKSLASSTGPSKTAAASARMDSARASAGRCVSTSRPTPAALAARPTSPAVEWPWRWISAR